MIDVRDLRIGNCFYVGELEKRLVVSEIDCCSATAFVNGEMITFNKLNLTPIPISPDWLKKLGFELDGNKYIYRFEPDCEWDYILFYLDWLEMKIDGEYWVKAKDVKYVHQLQNLIYELTKQELTIRCEE